MGISEDINWLKEDEDGVGKVFLLIADRGNVKLRELHQLFGVKDWWPVKSYLRALVDRELVVENEGSYSLTESGLKVFESYKTIEYVKPV